MDITEMIPELLTKSDYKAGILELKDTLSKMGQRKNFFQRFPVFFPLKADWEHEVPAGSQSLLIFPIGSAVLTGMVIQQDTLYMTIPANAVYPYKIPILPNIKQINIPAANGSLVSGGAEVVFCSEFFSHNMGSGATTINGSLVDHQKNAAVTANTNILISDYVASNDQKTVLQVQTDTNGVLSLVYEGIEGVLNGGVALNAGQLYAFEILLLSGLAYNLQLSTNATMQIHWAGGM